MAITSLNRLQKLWIKHGELVKRRAGLIKNKKSTAVVEREMVLTKAKIIKEELKAERKANVAHAA